MAETGGQFAAGSLHFPVGQLLLVLHNFRLVRAMERHVGVTYEGPSDSTSTGCFLANSCMAALIKLATPSIICLAVM
jgi:hypothetical protein